MAKRASKPNDNDDYIDDEIDEILDDDQPEVMADEVFQRVLTELSGGDLTASRVHVFRELKGKSHGAELFAMSPDEFDMAAVCERLRDDYGSGDYRAVLKKAGKIFKSMPIAVEVPKSRQAGVIPQAKESDDKFVAMMNAQMEQMRISAEEARRESRDAQKTMQTMMIEMIKAGSQRPEQSSTAELMNLLVMSKNLNGGGSGDAVSSLLQGIELGKELAGGASESPLLSALNTVAPILQQGMAMQRRAPLAAKKTQALPNGAKPANPVKSVKVVEPAPTPQEEDSQAEFLFMAKMIKRAIDNQSDPALYAELLLDQMGEAAVTAFSDDNQYNAFLLFFPGGLTDVDRVWLDTLREEVLTYANSDSDGSDDGETIPDDGTDEGAGDAS